MSVPCHPRLGETDLPIVSIPYPRIIPLLVETRWPNLDRRDISIARIYTRVFTASGPYLRPLLLLSLSPQNRLYAYTCSRSTRDSRRRFQRRSRGPAASRIARSRSRYQSIRKIADAIFAAVVESCEILALVRSRLASSVGITGTVAAPTPTERKAHSS